MTKLTVDIEVTYESVTIQNLELDISQKEWNALTPAEQHDHIIEAMYAELESCPTTYTPDVSDFEYEINEQ